MRKPFEPFSVYDLDFACSCYECGFECREKKADIAKVNAAIEQDKAEHEALHLYNNELVTCNEELAQQCAALKKENEEMFERQVTWATEHPTYQLSKQLEAELDAARAEVAKLNDLFNDTSRRCGELRAQLAAAEEVIRFYRDGQNPNGSWPAQIMVDGGRTARAYLAKFGEKKL